MLDGLNYTWHWSPITLGGLVILCLLYGMGIKLTYKDKVQTPLQRYRILAFAGANLLLALVLLTPLDTIARTQLFAAHMIQAVAITTLCAPLLLAACPDWLLQPLIAQPAFRWIFQTLTQPLVASILFNLTFLIWHAPGLYNAALARGTLYHVEMLSFLLTSLLNWWPLIGPLRPWRKLSYPQQMLYAFLDGQPVDIFAFLLVFTGVVFYKHYAIPSQFIAWGYSAVADQTIGGAFLLVPGLVDLVVMSPLFFLWLSQIERQAKVDDVRRQEEEEARLAAESMEIEGTEAEA
jgi:cytochrome c oxidase assembly factor CtaG